MRTPNDARRVGRDARGATPKADPLAGRDRVVSAHAGRSAQRHVVAAGAPACRARMNLLSYTPQEVSLADQ